MEIKMTDTGVEKVVKPEKKVSVEKETPKAELKEEIVKEEVEEKEEFLTEEDEPKEYHYIGVVFGNTKVLTESGQPTYDLSKTHYTYKTTQDYKKGQIISVPTKFGLSKVMVADENIDVSKISYDLDSILEI